MSTAKTFLKNYLSTAYSVITQPHQFFRNLPTSGSLKEPLSFAVLTIFIVSLLNAPITLISLSSLLSFGTDIVLITLVLAGVFLYYFFTVSIALPVNTLIYHLFLKICGAKGSLESTLRVFCYYLAVSFVILLASTFTVFALNIAESAGAQGILYMVLSLIFLLGVMTTIVYSFYVLIVGFSEVHNISMKRTVLAVLGVPTALFLLIMALMLGLIFVTEQSGLYETLSPYATDYNTHNQLQSDITLSESTLIAPYSTPPILDGYYTPDDKWDEAKPIKFISGGAWHTIAAKHDGLMLYILVMWEGEPEWTDSISLYFEQDGDSHDHDRYTGLIDEKYNGATKYGPSNFADAHNDEGVTESENGIVRGNYDNGLWVQEWVVPLKSGDHGDIRVDKFPTTLGFAIDSRKFSGPQWPSGNAHRLEPQYWGDLKILYSEDMEHAAQPPTITAANGTTPIIDGYQTPEDGWNETQQIYHISNNADIYTLAAKHDSDNLYIMVKWQGELGYTSSFIYFEQDGVSHDHRLTTGRDDRKHNNARNKYMDGRGKELTGEEQNGMARSNYSNGYWVYEWLVPLHTGDENDISVDRFPTNLGFMVEIGNKNKNGYWPYDAARWCSPRCWGDLMILE